MLGILNVINPFDYFCFRLKEVIRTALVDRVVEDLMDVVTPLKQFSDSVVKLNPDEKARNDNFEAKAANLSKFSTQAVTTAKMVAVGSNSGNKKVAEALIAYGGQCESLTPQLMNAGRIRMVYPDNKAAEEHFENLREQFAEGMGRIRGLCDEATDSVSFVQQSADSVRQRSDACEAAVNGANAVGLIENTSAVARLANRMIQVTKQEAENSEDSAFIAALIPAADKLQECKRIYRPSHAEIFLECVCRLNFPPSRRFSHCPRRSVGPRPRLGHWEHREAHSVEGQHGEGELVERLSVAQ